MGKGLFQEWKGRFCERSLGWKDKKHAKQRSATSTFQDHISLHFSIPFDLIQQSLSRIPQASFSSSVIRIKTNHQIIIPTPNPNLPPPRRRPLIPLPLTNHTRQILKRRPANTLRQTRRARRIREEAKNGRDGIAVGPRRRGGLVDLPGLLRGRHAGHLGHERGAGFRGVGFDRLADAVGAALFARVRGGVRGDLAQVGEAAHVGRGAVAGEEEAASGEFGVRGGDDVAGHGGYAAAVSGGFPVDHAFGVEVGYCGADAGG